MKNFYEVGRVYVWQNCTGRWSYLNGKETTVIGSARQYISDENKVHVGQETDTPSVNFPLQFIMALPGDLRPKRPPPGEQSVLDMFKQPYMVDA